ncbi:DEK domain-containing chromatin-associated protein 4-like [Lolium rigidum]|uniref:DEK domain-containing chromatin-associated protein 4-like n=1 Tax=Lolium rigidum TaxID=89674 RepID=UPI001F5D060F|nr:DEK domain-containing chromatin-associated protein 4-like [Lolium rigidum]
MECANGTSAGAGVGAVGNRLKESEFREQIVKLAGIACHEDEEKSRIELLEKLKGCNKIGLIEMCRYFDVRGSTSTRKDDIVTILMEFLMEHGSRIDCTDPDKKLRKRKRNRDGVDLSGGDPSKKRKPDGTVLETHGEEAAGKKCVKDRTNCSDFHLRGNRNVCTDNKTGQFSKGKAKPDQFEGVNGSMMEKLAVVPLPGLPIHTHEQILVTTPCAKFASDVENNSMDTKASTKKTISVSKKKATHTTDRNEKFCGNNSSRGDVKPRKQAVRPTKDELRHAVFCILDTANFATMTFGEVVKAVDKYFGKDLFERKPLIRALIEEELFRLAEEAEKKELEEEEAMGIKARAEQAAKASRKDGRVGSDIVKENGLRAGQDGKSKDAEKNYRSDNVEKDAGNGTSVKAVDNRSSDDAAESSQDGKAEVETDNETNCDGFAKDGDAGNIVQNANGDDGVEISKDGKTGNIVHNANGDDGKAEADRKNENNSDGFTKDGEAVNIVQNANGDDGVEFFKDGKAETVKNCSGNTIGGSEGVKAGEDEGTKDGRTEECISGNGAEKVGDCGPDESNTNEKARHVNCSEDGKSQEAGDNVNGQNTPSCGAECGNANETTENASTEQSRIGEDDDGKAEDAEQNMKAKVDVDSSNHGTAEDNAIANGDGQA